MQDKNTKYIVHILVACCGIALWLDVEGVDNELPVMINYLPEKWTLISYVNICMAVASPVALIIILFVNRCKRKNSKYVACSALINQVLQLIVLSFIWRKTIDIAGQFYSVGLFAVVFILGCFDRAYGVIFLSILQTMKSEYVSSYFIGEGIGMIISPVLAFIQGSGDIKCKAVGEKKRTFINGTWANITVYKMQPSYQEPMFSLQVYILIISAVALIPLVSFILLNWNPLSLGVIDESKRDVQFMEHNQDGKISGNYLPLPEERSELVDNSTSTEYDAHCYVTRWIKKHFYNAPAWNILALAAFVQMQLYAFPFALGTYYSLPYGPQMFHLIITIGNICIAMASITGHFYSVTSWPVICGMAVFSSSLSTYIIVIASLSPTPPLAGYLIGTVIMIGVWCIQGFLLAYLKLCLAKMVHENETSMTWFGAALELGYFGGNILSFLLIGVLKLFKEKSFC